MATTLFLGGPLTAPKFWRPEKVNDLLGVAQYASPNTLGTTRGSTATSISENTVAGPTAGLEFVGTAMVEFVSEPLADDVTIAGTITLNLRALENNMSANVAINAIIERLQPDGTRTQIAKTARTTELGTTESAQNFTVTPTSTAFSRGDRIVVRPFGDDAGTMASTFSFSLFYNGPTSGASGDTFVTFTETFALETEPSSATVVPKFTRLYANDVTAATELVTDSITPKPNALLILAVSTVGTASPTSITGNGLTWVLIAERSASGAKMGLYRAMGPSPSAGAVTVSFAASTTDIWVAIYEVENTDRSGTNGSGAIVQSVSNDNASSTTISATLAAFGSSRNAGFYAIQHGANDTFTPNSGWTMLRHWGNSNGLAEDGAKINATDPGGTFAGAAPNIIVAIEIKAAAPSTIYLRDTAASGSINPGSATEKEAWTTRGAASTTSTTTVPTGPTSGVQLTATAGGTALEWYTRPLGAFQLAGALEFRLRARRSAAGVSAGIVCEVAVTDGDGTNPTVIANAGGMVSGSPIITATTDTTPHYIGVLGLPRTNIADGKRLRIRFYVDDPLGDAVPNSGTLIVSYDGPTANAAGDSYVVFLQELIEATLGTTYQKAGSLTAAGLGAGADVAEHAETGSLTPASSSSGPRTLSANRAGALIASGRTSGADVAERSETGSLLAGALLAGAKGHELPRTGALVAAALVAGADVHEASRTGSLVAAGVVSGADAATHERAGSLTAAGFTSGADVHEAVETGALVAGALMSGVAVREAAAIAKSGALIAGALTSGADVLEATETGALIAGTALAGADVFESSETGSLVASALAAGVRVVTLNRTGSLLAGARASAADVLEASETGALVAGTSSSGADVHEASRTGALVAAALLAGADTATLTRAGSLLAGGVTSGADVFEATEAGSLLAGTTVSGTSARSGGETLKTGSIAAGARTSAADVHEAVRAGALIAGALTSGDGTLERSVTGSLVAGTLLAGADVREAVETGSLVAGSTLAGGDVREATRAGTVWTGGLVSGVSQRIGGPLDKAGTIAAGALAAGGDAHTAARTGALAAGVRTSGADATMFSRTGSVSSSGRTSGADTVDYIEAGAVAAGAAVAGASSRERNRYGSLIAGVTLSGADAATLDRTGTIAAGGLVAGADVATFNRTGSLVAGAVLAGPSTLVGFIQEGAVWLSTSAGADVELEPRPASDVALSTWAAALAGR